MSIQKINATDRIPTEVLSNGAIRYEEFDSNGNSLGYKYMKRADAPSATGTIANKALFDVYDNNDVEEEGERKRVDRYGTPTITNISMEYTGWITGDTIPKSGWTDTSVKEGENNGYVVTTNSVYNSSSSNKVTNAFDGDESTQWRGGNTTSYIQIEFPSATKVSKFFIPALSNAVSWTLSGSNDGSTYVQLATGVSSTTQTDVTITVSSPENYKYYKFTGSSSSASYATIINEFRTSEYWGTTTLNLNKLAFDYAINSYFANMRILIDIPSTDTTFSDSLNSCININNLGNKLINQTITKGKKYELVYDGSAFNATEVTL